MHKTYFLTCEENISCTISPVLRILDYRIFHLAYHIIFVQFILPMLMGLFLKFVNISYAVTTALKFNIPSLMLFLSRYVIPKSEKAETIKTFTTDDNKFSTTY